MKEGGEKMVPACQRFSPSAPIVGRDNVTLLVSEGGLPYTYVTLHSGS